MHELTFLLCYSSGLGLINFYLFFEKKLYYIVFYIIFICLCDSWCIICVIKWWLFQISMKFDQKLRFITLLFVRMYNRFMDVE